MPRKESFKRRTKIQRSSLGCGCRPLSFPSSTGRQELSAPPPSRGRRVKRAESGEKLQDWAEEPPRGASLPSFPPHREAARLSRAEGCFSGGLRGPAAPVRSSALRFSLSTSAFSAQAVPPPASTSPSEVVDSEMLPKALPRPHDGRRRGQRRRAGPGRVL